ncbi:MAG TPA: HAMP domain-containing sensor histidine kinase, partial [Thermoanaerobaculia bacterium]|nr:HAMP domain-containing sensor histidine kinase [Thermoanaerobaculia bacterium]
ETDGALSGFLSRLTVERRTHSEADAGLADRDRLLTIFAHDLRNLLSVLTVNAELFLRREGEAAKTNGRNIRATIGRMTGLINSLADLAALNAGQLKVRPETSDMAAPLREAVEIFRPVALAKSIVLDLVDSDASLPAIVDHGRIFQVLSNLLGNAVKFTEGGGKISVSATALDDEVQVTVTDTGIGIPEEDLTRIFELYRQLGSSRDGLGLGLYISKAVVEKHGGRIWATSRVGVGSTFYFTVPAATAS